MKNKLFVKQNGRMIVCLLILVIASLSSCEKKLENTTYGTFSDDNFPKTAKDALGAVNDIYTGLMEGAWSAGWGSAQASFPVQASQTTDEGVCNWDDGGSWKRLNSMTFTPDFGSITGHYTALMPYISNATKYISNIELIDMDATLKNRYIAELKALRAYYMQILYLYYGPVPARLDPTKIDVLTEPAIPRPSHDEMISNIVKDFTDAIAVLPNKFSGSDYGRFSKAACFTSLLKLYMQEKRWTDALAMGDSVKAIGYSLVPEYGDLFSIKNKTENTETILPIVCAANGNYNTNIYRPHYLPTDYYDSTNGGFGYQWGGYRMPWKTYDKFDQTDYRLKYLLKKYPTLVGGKIVYRDARAGGDIGAVMVKYGPDPSNADAQNSGVNYVAMRYADVELLLAEAINEKNGAPTSEAYGYINDVRTKHGKLSPYAEGSLNQITFRTAIQNERLFELWAEGARRDDLIRWGLYIQRAKDDGYTVDDHLILYPLPRDVVNQSKNVIAQNPNYN